ncbi:MAG: LysM peptidoglycan-binding domain-containing protein, partial [Anaerolineales bacterium]
MSDKPSGSENPKMRPFRPLKHRKSREFPAWGLWVITIVLILSGLALLISWLNQPGRLINRLLATNTPSPTATFTPTVTPTATETPTMTPTPTETLTPTPSAPFTYIVQEGDSLYRISEKFNLGEKGVLLLLILNPRIDPCNPILRIGEEIIVPNPGMPVPTATPLPTNLPRNTKVRYMVQPGDTLATIAAIFNSTIEAI